VVVGVATAQSTAVQNNSNTGGIVLLAMDATGAIIENAGVKLIATGQPVQVGITDRDGKLRFVDLAAGSYVIVVSSPGFKTYSEEVNAIQGKITNLHVTLDLAAGSGPLLCVEDPVEIPVIETQSDPISYIPLAWLPLDKPNRFLRFFRHLLY
jgi:hypothetical protein